MILFDVKKGDRYITPQGHTLEIIDNLIFKHQIFFIDMSTDVNIKKCVSYTTAREKRFFNKKIIKNKSVRKVTNSFKNVSYTIDEKIRNISDEFNQEFSLPVGVGKIITLVLCCNNTEMSFDDINNFIISKGLEEYLVENEDDIKCRSNDIEYEGERYETVMFNYNVDTKKYKLLISSTFFKKISTIISDLNSLKKLFDIQLKEQICTMCGENKPITSFTKDRWNETKRICDDCRNIGKNNKKDINKRDLEILKSKGKFKETKICSITNKVLNINVLKENYSISFKKNGFYVDRDRLKELNSSNFEYFDLPYRSMCKDEYDRSIKSEDKLNKIRCSTCGEYLDKSEFIKDRWQPSGIRGDCKICHNKITKLHQPICTEEIFNHNLDRNPFAKRIRLNLNRVITSKDVGIINNNNIICHEGVDYSIYEFENHISFKLNDYNKYNLYLDSILTLDTCHIDHILPIHFINWDNIKSTDDEIKISKIWNSLINLRPIPASTIDGKGNLNRLYLDDPDDKILIIETYNKLKIKYPYIVDYMDVTKLQQLI